MQVVWCHRCWTRGCVVNTGRGSIVDAKGAVGGRGQW